MQLRLTYLLIPLSLVGAISGANADTVIREDRGGLIFNYVTRLSAAKESGERFVIDGLCLSACTLILHFIPRDRMCSTRNGRFGFHAAWEWTPDGDTRKSIQGTQRLMQLYPRDVRAFISGHGGLKKEMFYTRATTFIALCKPVENRSVSAKRKGPYQGADQRSYARGP